VINETVKVHPEPVNGPWMGFLNKSLVRLQ